MSWTDERIATLKKMWKEGHSAADIAKKLGDGVTRNAVIGKAHRMGLSGRPSPIKPPPAAKKPTKKPEASKPAAPKAAVKKKEEKKPAPVAKAPAGKGVKEKTAVSKPAFKEKTPANVKKAKKAGGFKPSQEELEELRLEAETPPADGGVALIDLTERMCKWPFGDPQEDNFTFCGKEIYPGKPYCPDHVLLAYQSSAKARAAIKMRDMEAEEDEEEADLDVDEVDSDEVDEDEVGVAD